MHGVSGHLTNRSGSRAKACRSPGAASKTNYSCHGRLSHRPTQHISTGLDAAITATPLRRGCTSTAAALPSPLAARGTSDSSTSSSSSSSSSQLFSRRERRRPVLYLDPPTLNWDRWELLMYRRAQEAGTGEDEEEGEEEGEDDDDDDISFASRLAASDLNAAYFRRWDDPAVHQSMMQDRVLTAAWREALAAAPPGALEGRTVLDVGCGLGLLSMLAAKAGAARVVAVDGSEGAVDAARRIIKANGLSDKITVVHGVLEELDELPGMSPSGFDVVMSNWMGPALLGGGMMATLAHAIKKWLRPGGVVLPDRVSLWAAGLEDRDALQEAKESWSRVAGLDMSAALSQVIKHPRRDVITRKAQLLTAPQRLAVWDLTELRPEHVLVMRRSGGRDRNEEEEEEEGEEEEQEEAVYASCPFRFTSLRDERLFGLVLFWEALWTWGGALEGEGKSPVRFTTHPLASSTHYQQIMIDMPRTVRVAADDEVSGELVLKPGSTDPRDVEMQLRVEHGGAQQPITASYRVAHLAV